MKKILALMLMISVLVLIVGCAPKVADVPTAGAPGAIPVIEETEPTTEADIQEVTTDLEDIDTLEEDLDFSELDELEQELEDIDW